MYSPFQTSRRDVPHWRLWSIYTPKGKRWVKIKDWDSIWLNIQHGSQLKYALSCSFTILSNELWRPPPPTRFPLLTARVLSPTLDAMRPSIVPYSASRDVSLSIWLLWMRLNTRMAMAERTMRTMIGATMTIASVVTL